MMTEREKWEHELETVDKALLHLKNVITRWEERRNRAVMNLNRARRLEREELQNGKQ